MYDVDNIHGFIKDGVDDAHSEIGKDIATYIEDVIRIRLGEHRNSVRVSCDIKRSGTGATLVNLSINADNSEAMAIAEDISNEVLSAI